MVSLINLKRPALGRRDELIRWNETISVDLVFRYLIGRVPCVVAIQIVFKIGGLEKVRTSNLLIRSQVLYPVELRSHFTFITFKRIACLCIASANIRRFFVLPNV
jgi:hypothetical protein